MRELMNYILMTIIVASGVGGVVYGVGSNVADFDVLAAQQEFEATRPAVKAAIESWPKAELAPKDTPTTKIDGTQFDPFAIYNTHTKTPAANANETSKPAIRKSAAVKRSSTASSSGRSSHGRSWGRSSVGRSGSAHGGGYARSYYMRSFQTKTSPYFQKAVKPRGMTQYSNRNRRHLSTSYR